MILYVMLVSQLDGRDKVIFIWRISNLNEHYGGW